MKHRLWETPEPSSAGVSGFVLLTANGRSLDIQFDYDRDGEIYTIGLRFSQVRAHRHRAELYTTPWHIAEVFDNLVEIKPSEWVAELLGDTPADKKNDWVMRHFMITLDSAGCFEVVAGNWEILPEVHCSLPASRAR